MCMLTLRVWGVRCLALQRPGVTHLLGDVGNKLFKHCLQSSDEKRKSIEAYGVHTSQLKIMFVRVVTRSMHMSMYVDMVFLTLVDVAVVNLVQNVGGVAEEIPVMGDNDLV